MKSHSMFRRIPEPDSSEDHLPSQIGGSGSTQSDDNIITYRGRHTFDLLDFSDDEPPQDKLPLLLSSRLPADIEMRINDMVDDRPPLDNGVQLTQYEGQPNTTQQASNNGISSAATVSAAARLPDEIILNILLHASKLEGLRMWIFDFPAPAAVCLKWFWISFEYYYEHWGWLHGKKHLFEDWLRAAHNKNYECPRKTIETNFDDGHFLSNTTQIRPYGEPSLTSWDKLTSATKKVKVGSCTSPLCDLKADIYARSIGKNVRRTTGTGITLEPDNAPGSVSARRKAMEWYRARKKRLGSSQSTIRPLEDSDSIKTIPNRDMQCSACHIRI